MADNRNYVQARETVLFGSGVTATATTVILSELVDPQGNNLTTANFGAVGYGTFEPGTEREENFSFTTVTQNADGTATLTGVVRGLKFVADYTTDTTLRKEHGGSTPVIISNAAPFYNNFANKENDETISQTWTYDTANFPRMSESTTAPTDDEELATKKYVDDTAGGTPVSINRVVVSGNAGETITIGQFVYFDPTDKEWKLTDASAAATSDNQQLGIAQGAGTDGNPITGGILLVGRDSNQSGLTAGDEMFLSDTPGAIANTPGTIEVEVGYVPAGSTTEINFTPKYASFTTKDQRDDLDTITGAAAGDTFYSDGADLQALSIGTAGQRLQVNSGATAPEWLDVVDTQVFTVDGTWTKPANATYVHVICIGAGGGGGSGRTGTAVNAKTGGGGGGGGAVTFATFLASALGATETINVGTGGTGGAAEGASDTDGNPGTDGSRSTFGDWLRAGAGGLGAGGVLTPSTNPGGGGGGSFGNASGTTGGVPQVSGDGISGQGPDGQTAVAGDNAEYGGGAGGGCGLNQAGSDGGSSIFSAGGGGAGGASSSGSGDFAGGDGGNVQAYTAGGGAAGGAGGTNNGTNGTANSTLARGYGGTGAGGGGGSSSGAGGAGGEGGIPGGGGGGGGCALNTNSSGAGGDGARGEVRVYSW